MRKSSLSFKAIKRLIAVNLALLVICVFSHNEAAAAIDVQPLNVSLGSSSVATGGSLSVSWQIRNNGSTSAGTSNSQVRITTSSTSFGNSTNNVGSAVATGTIGAGVTISQNRSVTVPSAAGTYYVWVIADNNSALTQTNINNDSAVSSALTVTAAGTIDVQPLNVSLGSSSVATGGSLSVSWQIRNNGTTSASTSNSQVRITTSSTSFGNSTNNVGSAVATGTIGAGVTISQNKSVTVPSAAGTYYVWVIADNNSALTQTNINNDSAVSSALTVTAAGTIDVQPLNVSLGSSSVATGGSLSVSWQIRNNGTTSASTSNSQVRITTSSTSFGNSTNNVGSAVATGTIGAGVTINQSTTVTVPSAAGTYYVWVIADNNSALTQSNINNDSAVSSTLTVTVAGTTPDLVPQNISVAPNPVVPGGSITLNWTLRNQGAATAGSSVTGARILSANSSATCSGFLSAIVSAATSGSLAAGNSVAQSATITAPTTAGTYYICVIADNASGSPAQGNVNTSNDYLYSSAFTVSASNQPDLVPQSISLGPNPAPGGNVNVVWTLKNQGTATAGASTTGIRILSSNTSSTCSGASTLTTVSASSLSAGTSVAQFATVSAPTTPGTYYVCVIADNATGSPGQGNVNTSNDYKYSVSFSVAAAGQADLIPQTIAVAPNPVSPGGSINVSWTLRNQGTSVAGSSVTGLRILSANSSTTCSGSTSISALTSASTAGSLVSGGSVPQSATVAAPTTPGTYYACVLADNAAGSPAQGNVNTTNDYQYSAAFTVTGVAPTVADLVVQNFSVSMTAAPGGQLVTITGRMKNLGGSTAASSITNLRISASQSNVTDNDPLLSPISVKPLSPNAPDDFQDFSVPVTVPVLPVGQYYIWAIAGKTNQGAAQITNDKVFIPFTVITGPVEPIATLSFRNPLKKLLDQKVENYSISDTKITVNDSGIPTAIAAGGKSAAVVKLVSMLANTPVTFSATPTGTITAFNQNYITNPVPGSSPSVTVNSHSYQDTNGRYVYLALLWSPENMPANAASPPSADLTVTATQSGTNTTSATIKLQPPPVILIHGIWSSPEESKFARGSNGFTDWLLADNKYPHDFVDALDYGSLNAHSFADNDIQQKMKDSTYGLLLRAAKDNYMVARQVDVVAHSMGGLVTRYFMSQPPLSNPLSLNIVRTLVTIGTPHDGSPLAAKLWANRDTLANNTAEGFWIKNVQCRSVKGDIGPCVMSTYMDKVQNKKVLSGGVESLQPNTSPLNTLSPGARYFAIRGKALATSKTGEKLDQLVNGFLENQSLATIMGPDHDTIVPLASQLGTASVNSDTINDSTVNDIVHADIEKSDESETESPAVRNKVFYQLTGQQPPVQAVMAERSASKSSSATGTALLSATPADYDLTGYTEVENSNVEFAPSSGSNLMIGTLTTIVASSTTKTISTVILTQLVTDPTDVPELSVTQTPFSMPFTPRRLGSANFVAVTKFTDMTYAVTPLSYTLLASGSPVSLSLPYAPAGKLAMGTTTDIRAMATYANGLLVDVSKLVTYTARSGTGAVFSVGANGSITATGPGVDWLDVTYQGLTTFAEILVGGPVTTPGPPIVVSTTIGTGSITMNFTAPTSTGSTAITEYTAACISSNGGASGANTGGASTTSITVSGLTNGRSYTCTVTASNSTGAGQSSASSNSLTPLASDITPVLYLLLLD